MSQNKHPAFTKLIVKANTQTHTRSLTAITEGMGINQNRKKN